MNLSLNNLAFFTKICFKFDWNSEFSIQYWRDSWEEIVVVFLINCMLFLKYLLISNYDPQPDHLELDFCVWQY